MKQHDLTDMVRVFDGVLSAFGGGPLPADLSAATYQWADVVTSIPSVRAQACLDAEGTARIQMFAKDGHKFPASMKGIITDVMSRRPAYVDVKIEYVGLVDSWYLEFKPPTGLLTMKVVESIAGELGR